MSKVLVTGGAGFIGSHLVDALIDKGHEVTIFDSLDAQVHPGGIAPDYLNKEARFIKGDIRDLEALARAMRGQEVIFHQAAAVGVGQSMYEISRYVAVNSLGTANVLDLAVNRFRDQIQKMIVASSMSIYGEGAYVNSAGDSVAATLRAEASLKQGQWELVDPMTGSLLQPSLTPETKMLEPTSVYAITKKDQEELFLVTGRSYNLPVVALRYFNVFGPRQSLSNPYTGVCAIFSSRLKNGNSPVIYEDGCQTRDFVSVHDIVRANMLAMECNGADYCAVNIGSAKAVSILKVAEVLAELYGVSIKPQIEGKFRIGDIRHCVADISLARERLGYEPQVGIEQGMKELVAWGMRVGAIDKMTEATEALRQKGLLV